MATGKDRLAVYRKKRDFDRTPEPAPRAGGGEGRRRFVIQKHDASRPHDERYRERVRRLVTG